MAKYLLLDVEKSLTSVSVVSLQRWGCLLSEEETAAKFKEVWDASEQGEFGGIPGIFENYAKENL